MKEIKNRIPQLLGILLLVCSSIGWLIFQIFLWEDRIFPPDASIFDDFFGRNRVEHIANTGNAYYLITLIPILLGYFGWVLWQRNHPFSGTPWKKLLYSTIAVLLLAGFYPILMTFENSYLLAGIILAEILLTIGIIYIPSIIKNHQTQFKKENIGNAVARYFLCICISILIAVLYALALGVLESCKPHTTTRIISYFSAECSTASGLFSGLIMAPFVEEQIFRGLIFGKLKNLCHVWIAAGFSAILFGLWHRNLAQFVGTVPTGLILAFVYHQTGRLRYAMVCHNLSNLLMFLAVVKKGVLPNIPFLHTMQEKIVYQLPLPLDLIFIALFTSVIVWILWKVLPLVSEPKSEKIHSQS